MDNTSLDKTQQLAKISHILDTLEVSHEYNEELQAIIASIDAESEENEEELDSVAAFLAIQEIDMLDVEGNTFKEQWLQIFSSTLHTEPLDEEDPQAASLLFRLMQLNDNRLGKFCMDEEGFVRYTINVPISYVNINHMAECLGMFCGYVDVEFNDACQECYPELE